MEWRISSRHDVANRGIDRRQMIRALGVIRMPHTSSLKRLKEAHAAMTKMARQHEYTLVDSFFLTDDRTAQDSTLVEVERAIREQAVGHLLTHDLSDATRVKQLAARMEVEVLAI